MFMGPLSVSLLLPYSYYSCTEIFALSFDCTVRLFASFDYTARLFAIKTESLLYLIVIHDPYQF